jgi:hypothetical protein
MIVFFKNKEIYNKAKIGYFIMAFFYKDFVEVTIDDLSKDNIKQKTYTLEEFNQHFYKPVIK